MKSITRFIFGLALAGLALLPRHEAHAAGLIMCAPDPSNAAAGPRTFGGANSAVPSQTLYALNSAGCVYVVNGDVGYFRSQGFTEGPEHIKSITVTGVLTGTTAVSLGSLPANAVIREILVLNTTTNAVTGGIDVGTTSGGADVVSALTCAASCFTFVADSALLKRMFSATVAQPLFANGHTAGNSANLTIEILYTLF